MAKEQMKELSYDGSKCVVEVARRDAKGNTIDSTYATKTEMATADTQTLTSAKNYTATEITTEIAARKQGDSDTLASAKEYTDTEIAKVDHTKFVTIDTEQDITGAKTFTSAINVNIDNVKTIYSTSGITVGSNVLTYPSASGTLALASQIPSLTDYVTLNTNQTIKGIKYFPGGIRINKIMENVNGKTYVSYTESGTSKLVELGINTSQLALHCALNSRPMVKIGDLSTAYIAYTADIKLTATDVEIG